MTTERWVDIRTACSRSWPAGGRRHCVARTRSSATSDPGEDLLQDESVSPPGSHKPNTAVAQAWYNKQYGIKRLTTETGAGQWGCALAFAGQLLRHPGRRLDGAGELRAEAVPQDHDGDLGARCLPSPSSETRPGGRSSSRTRTLLAASASPSARPSRRRSPTLRGRPATRSAASSITSCCTRRSSGWRRRSSSRSRRRPA